MNGTDFLYDRLIVRGELNVPHALHIGSGETSRRSDAPIRRDAHGRPYIPGSSLAGVLRSAATDFAPYFFANGEGAIEKLFGKSGWDRAAQKVISKASRILVEDALLLTALPAEVEVREHVGIDRRKGAARPRLHYDREVTPSNTRYRFEVSIQRPKETEVQLLLAVLDFWNEFGFLLGGRTTTGLGEAKIDADSLKFYRLDFSRPDILRAYLCCGDPQAPVEYLPPESRVQRESLLSPVQATLPSPDTKSYAEAFCPQHLFLTIALIPEEPLLVQAPIPRIPDPDAPLVGPDRASDADFVTALVAADAAGNLAERHYLPGSSLKGVWRTRAEKIVRTLTFCRGGEDTTTDDGYRTAQADYQEHLCACAATHGEPDGEFPEPERLLACFGTAVKQREAQRKARELDERRDRTFARQLYDKSCVTCRLFGNTMMQGRLHVGDATLVVEPRPKLFDHVAIDRFHGGAEDQRKFDTRPLMPTVRREDDPRRPLTFQQMFTFRLHLERFEPWMLGLLGHLLKDLCTADLRLGHATRRGYGRIRGAVTLSELLVLPGSTLESLCVDQGILPKDQSQRQRFGPYWHVQLALPHLFGQAHWSIEGLQDEALEAPAAKLLTKCDRYLREVVIRTEEGKAHGRF